MFNDLSDGGIVLVAQYSGDIPISFLGIGANGQPGKAGLVRNLSSANWIASDWFFVGASAKVALTVSGAIGTGVKIRMEGRRRDTVNDADGPPIVPLFRPFLIDTTRTDSPATAAAKEQTILAADFRNGLGTGTDQVSDWNGTAAGAAAASEALDVRLLSSDALMSGWARVLLISTAGPTTGDKIIVSVNRG